VFTVKIILEIGLSDFSFFSSGRIWDGEIKDFENSSKDKRTAKFTKFMDNIWQYFH